MAIHHRPYDPVYYSIPPPPPPLAVEYAAGYDDPNAIKTLFVSGLPDDVKPREIHNLFRHRPGFDYCQLKYTGRGNQVVAFATFVNHASAITALHTLNGVKFDPQTGTTLHIELARSNSTRKNKPGAAGPGAYVVIDRRSTATNDGQESSDDGDSETEEPSEHNKDASTKSDEEKAAEPENTEAAENEQTENLVDGACSTLFIANLGPTCTESELKPVLSRYPGFNTLKVRNRGGMPVAFADYEEVEQATEVMNTLQGSTLPSSDRGGMHIEYARSKMRKR
ncbi:uncharacterized protein LOC143601616 [Bidens hawaiensis]|uniref:uncharacterized protein LOC143601616 n=1 Tax=Bidens hawaiensis TaxID=980011 RepID=UPI00404AE720